MNGEPVVTSYNYDDANRLTQVDDQAYTWDANGNLLDDGLRQYSYDAANRLTGLSDEDVTYSYAYNGLGDRVSLSVDGETVNYQLDLNSGLTQVLSDGANTYLYGHGRIAQDSGEVVNYFLPDALGSVRTVLEGDEVLLAQDYAPYGEVLASAGSGASVYGFAGEWTDSSGLQYLRARFYDPSVGRFVSRDSWGGNSKRPLSMNRWIYVEGNPINWIDPSGLCYTNSNIFSAGYWEKFFETPILGPCPSERSPLPPPRVITTTLTPTTCPPVIIQTPTATTTPNQILQYLGKWRITHYNIALEWDPQFPSINKDSGESDYVIVPGLDKGKFQRQFIYSPAGIYMQGTGKSESGDYITIDHFKNEQEYGKNWIDDTKMAEWYFTYGKGGRNSNPIAWKTVAMNRVQKGLNWGDKVKIGQYPGKTFEVADTGTFDDTDHLDVFVGEMFYEQARSLGDFKSDVWKILGE